MSSLSLTPRGIARRVDIIIDRAKRIAKEFGTTLNETNLRFSLLAVDDEIGLDWDGLVQASPGDFSHDVYGILHHFNPATRTLEDCFLPRYAVREEKK